MAETPNPTVSPESILDHVQAGVVVHAADTRIVSANPAACGLLGLSREQLRGRSADDPCWKFLRSDGSAMPRHEYPVNQVVGTKQSLREFVLGIRRPQSSDTVWVQVNAEPLTGSAGDLDSVVVTFMDITERKRAEDALVRVEREWRQTFDGSLDALCFLDVDQRILRCNRTMSTLFNKPRETIVGKLCYDVVHGTAKPIAGCPVERMRRTLRRETMELSLNGRTFDVSADPVLDGNGTLRAIVHSLRDVTERVRAQEALVRSEEQYKTLAENINIGVLIAALDGRVIHANRAAAEIGGFSSVEEFIHAPTSDFYADAKQREGVIADLHKKGFLRNTEVRIRHRNRSFIWVSIDAILLRDKMGKPVNILCTIQDITERKDVEAKLLASEEKYRVLAESSPGMIYLIDREGVVRYVNAASKRIFHMQADRITGRHLADIFPAPIAARHLAAVQGVIQTGKPFSAEQLEPFPGGMCWIDARLSPVKDSSGAIVGVLGLSQDITERKRMEEELKKSVELYHDLVETAQDLIWQCDAEGRFTYLNPAWETVFGYRLDEMLGRKINEFQPEEQARRDKQEYSPLLRSGTIMGYETVLRAKDGHDVHLVFNAKSIRDDSGTITGIRGTAYDITQRKKAEEELRESERRYRSIFEHSNDGFFLHDFKGYILDCNENLCRMLGYSRDELVGAHLTKIDSPHEQKLIPERLRSQLETGVLHFEGHHVRKDGGLLAIDVSARVVSREGKGLVQSFVRDISERKRAEEALRTERDRAQRYLDIAGVMFVALDTQGRVTLINQKGERILGRSEREIIGKDWFETFVPVSMRREVRVVFDRMMAGEIGPVEYHENVILTNQGEERTIAWHNILLRDETGTITGTLSSGEDVSQRKKMEEELARKQKIDALGVLAGGIAHDFNNLLAGIFGFMDLARQAMRPGDPAVGYLGKAFVAFERAKSLSSQLLTFSKGGAPLKRPLQLAGLLRECGNLSLSGSNVRCTYAIKEGLSAVEGDEHQLSQVISNLIINARQAMPDGGTIAISAENRSLDGTGNLPLPAGHYVVVTVTDEGIGIPDKIIEKIFDPFFTTKQQGSGLGLAIGYSIVNRHGGNISVASTPGEGTVFTVWLPASQKAPSSDAGALDEKSLRGSGRILVMDDEPSIREMATHMLGSFGYTVDTVSDGKGAVERYRRAFETGQPYDLVILDLTVPGGMGGHKAIQELRKIDPRVAACVTSGYAENEVLSNPEKFGFMGMIAKPYRTSDLLKTVKAMLQKTAGRR
ncbi:MAG: PAS domain S-box protein [Chitinispirillaceae bacterium]|nr:PAS domain S-box protein [Chitinispirillaceae bacterium]